MPIQDSAKASQGIGDLQEYQPNHAVIDYHWKVPQKQVPPNIVDDRPSL